MPDNAHDTLGLFDNTAPGWTVETPQAEPQPATPTPTAPDAESSQQEAAPAVRGKNFYLEGDRGLARGWTTRASDNVAATLQGARSLPRTPIRGERPCAHSRGAGVAAAFRRLRGHRAGAGLLPVAW